MCIIIYKPEDMTLGKKPLKKSFTYNDDGCGYMFSYKNELIIKKGYFKFEQFYHDFRIDQALIENKNMVIHFRITTHGITNKENTHPFLIEKHNIGLVHNGIIDTKEKPINDSDTRIFCQEIMEKLPRGFFNNDVQLMLIAKYIFPDKIAIMDKMGNVKILNKHEGITSENGIWYSNSSYKNNTISKFSIYDDKGYDSEYDSWYHRKDGDRHTTCMFCYQYLSHASEYQDGYCSVCKYEITSYMDDGYTKPEAIECLKDEIKNVARDSSG